VFSVGGNRWHLCVAGVCFYDYEKRTMLFYLWFVSVNLCDSVHFVHVQGLHRGVGDLMVLEIHQAMYIM
jgi:hypothetical protein